MSRLRHLSLCEVYPVSRDRFYNHFGRLTSLECLDLWEEDYRALTPLCLPPSLRSLCINMGGTELEHPDHVPFSLPHSLTRLTLRKWDFSDKGDELMRRVASLPSLGVLDLTGSCVRDLDFGPLTGSSSLTQLILRGCTHPQLPAGLRALAVF